MSFSATCCVVNRLQALNRHGVIKRNTLLRVVYTLGVSLILSQNALAQDDTRSLRSVLNFVKATVSDRMDAGIAVTNPTSNYADVQFTFYGLDGNPISPGLGVNPVRYRVAPRGQVSMPASELFAGSRADGWIQVTSPSAGLLGYYLSGDFTTALEGAEASPALTTQVIPILRQDQVNSTDLVVVNPGTVTGSVNITFFNAAGQAAGTPVNRSIGPHAALRLPVIPAGNLSARISSSIPVSGAAVIERDSSILFAGGQPVDQAAAVRVAPHFLVGNGFDSILLLTNPAASPVNVNVTLFSDGGSVSPALAAAASTNVSIPANGSVAVNTQRITGLPFSPSVNGWLRIDSGNIPLNGLLIVDQGQSLTAMPLETVPLDRMLYSRISETSRLFTGLVWINSSPVDAILTVSLVHPDGTTFAQRAVDVPANSKYSALLGDIIPRAAGENGGYVFVRSTVPVWGTGIIGSRNYDFLAAMPASRIPDALLPAAIPVTPAITLVDPGTEVRPGAALRITVSNLAADAVFTVGGQRVEGRSIAPGIPVFAVTVPALEPGSVKLRVRSNGVESSPVPLRILPADSLPAQMISGQAFYQKIDVTDAGLDLSHPVMAPIRNGRVEVLDRVSQALVAVSDTDAGGKFEVPVPILPNLTIRVVSRLRTGEIRIADNTNQNALYSVSADIDAREITGNVLLVDNSRVSGAFNILEMVQRGNDLIRSANPSIVPPSVTIYWSARNTKRLVGTTYFNISNGTAFVLGDRSDDSDEFDDSVIVHEYAHMLAVRFSRDDSPGGAHSLGDFLDPRVAWSEGWADFFSCAVRNDAIYRDSRGPDGKDVLRYDLEDNRPAGDNPGIWSEASVDSLLWDLYDDRADERDNVQYPFALIWSAFTDLQSHRFVYLPYFLERFLERNQPAAETLRLMAQLRMIDFQPNVRPSVTNPFPRVMDVGETVTGNVDSLTARRNNLMQSAHFMMFTTGGGNASIRLDITGLGPAQNPNANDLDLFLLDANGRILDRSDRGLNGQSELISVRLPAGTYVVEVRSYYTKAETGGTIYNSGTYRLSVLVQ